MKIPFKINLGVKKRILRLNCCFKAEKCELLGGNSVHVGEGGKHENTVGGGMPPFLPLAPVA